MLRLSILLLPPASCHLVTSEGGRVYRSAYVEAGGELERILFERRRRIVQECIELIDRQTETLMYASARPAVPVAE